MARVGAMLRALRAKRNLTQEDLAATVQVTRFYISPLETGLRKNPSLPVRKRLATALKAKVGKRLEQRRATR